MSSSDVPTYEGRRLARPNDEIVDQGLGFDVATLWGRRRVLQVVGLGAVGVGFALVGAGVSAAADTVTTEIPDETAGPYPGDGSNGPDVLAESGIVRSDIRSSFSGSTGTAEGVAMTLQLTLLDLGEGVPFAGVAVYVWHCNRDGDYSMYSAGITDQNYLRGVQIADVDGVVTFTSIFPACYSGRWPHIHFEVYPSEADITDATNAIATSQIALPQATCDLVDATAGYEDSVSNLAQITLDTDNVFGDDGGVLELGTATGAAATGYTVTLTAAVDTTTTPTAGSAPTGGGGPTQPATTTGATTTASGTTAAAPTTTTTDPTPTTDPTSTAGPTTSGSGIDSATAGTDSPTAGTDTPRRGRGPYRAGGRTSRSARTQASARADAAPLSGAAIRGHGALGG